MSQYPMYPTQLSYLPAAGMYATYPTAANYCMLPAMYGGMTSAAHHQPQTTVQASSSSDEASQSRDREGSAGAVTAVSSSVADFAPACDNASLVGDDRAEYIEELNREKDNLEQKDSAHAKRLIDRGNCCHDNCRTMCPSVSNGHVNRHISLLLTFVIVTEISLVQSGQSSLPTSCETQMVDVYREKPIRLVVKVSVPVKEHPKVCRPHSSCFLVTTTNALSLHCFVIVSCHDAFNIACCSLLCF